MPSPFGVLADYPGCCAGPGRLVGENYGVHWTSSQRMAVLPDVKLPYSPARSDDGASLMVVAGMMTAPLRYTVKSLPTRVSVMMSPAVGAADPASATVVVTPPIFLTRAYTRSLAPVLRRSDA